MIEQVLFKLRLWRELPETSLILGFLSAILIGTFMLMLPASTVDGRGADLVTALFTSTSATCVTGLIVVDTGTYFTRFGQSVILALIQAGGLGIMTFTALFAWLGRRKISIQSRFAIRDTFLAQSESISLRRILLFILSFTVLFELVGTGLLFIQFSHIHGWEERLYHALFHSVSAFCNAGFSLYEDSLIAFRGSWPILSVFMILIVAGGLGYPVYLEARNRLTSRKTVRWSLHSRVVVTTTLFLIVFGTVMAMIGMPDLSLLDALFQSVTARTAGFNSVPFGHLAHSVMLILMALMFIGGSPGSCAGGIKTSTFAGMIIVWKDWLIGHSRKRVFGRMLERESVRKIKAVAGLAFTWVMLSFLILLYTEVDVLKQDPAAFQDLLFETISAMGTVGLSTGATPHLTTAGRIIIIINMFVGRVGPLAVVTALLKSRRTRAKIEHPEEKIMVG